MADVMIFISYAHEDKALADQIATDIQVIGAGVWIDHMSIAPGHPDWQAAVERGVKAATAVVYLGSPEAKVSDYVRSEIGLAKSSKVLIVPLFVRGSDWLDASPHELYTTNALDVRNDGYPQVRKFLFQALGILNNPNNPSGPLAKASSGSFPNALAGSIPGGQAIKRAPGTSGVESSGGLRLTQAQVIPTGSAVHAVDWARGRGLVASANEDHTARIYDATSGHLMGLLAGHTRALKGIAWSPLGDRIATASDDQSVRIWDSATFRTVRILRGHAENAFMSLTGARGAVWSVDWSPDGARIVTAGNDNLVRIWDAHTGHRLAILKGHTQPCRCVAWSPDSRKLATANDDGALRLWDAMTGDPLAVLPAHAGAVTSVAWSADGTRLVTAGVDGTARIWSAASLESVRDLT